LRIERAAVIAAIPDEKMSVLPPSRALIADSVALHV
jgi:hypothetical protein